MANNRPTLYIGVTNNLERRVFEHKNGIIPGFSSQYGLSKLVYFEETNDIESAIHREKRLKHWNRQWKLDLIEKFNPKYLDLSQDWVDPPVKP